MSAVVMAATFENCRESCQIGVHVCKCIDERISDACLRREVDHVGKAMVLKKSRDPLAIGKVKLGEAKTIEFGKLRAPRFLERRIVIGIHVIEPDNLAAIAQKPMCDVVTDEPGRTGDENGTVSHLTHTGPESSRLEPPQIDPLRFLRAIELCLHI